jgi:transposase-like protein
LPHRRRWKEAEARAVLAAFAASGSSLTEFARVEGLEPERLRRWQHRLARAEQLPPPAPARPRRKSSAAPAAPALIELRSPPSARRAEVIEVVLVSGVTLRVAETIEPAALARLVSELERGC